MELFYFRRQECFIFHGTLHNLHWRQCSRLCEDQCLPQPAQGGSDQAHLFRLC